MDFRIELCYSSIQDSMLLRMFTRKRTTFLQQQAAVVVQEEIYWVYNVEGGVSQLFVMVKGTNPHETSCAIQMWRIGHCYYVHKSWMVSELSGRQMRVQCTDIQHEVNLD